MLLIKVKRANFFYSTFFWKTKYFFKNQRFPIFLLKLFIQFFRRNTSGISKIAIQRNAHFYPMHFLCSLVIESGVPDSRISDDEKREGRVEQRVQGMEGVEQGVQGVEGVEQGVQGVEGVEQGVQGVEGVKGVEEGRVEEEGGVEGVGAVEMERKVEENILERESGVEGEGGVEEAFADGSGGNNYNRNNVSGINMENVLKESVSRENFETIF
jgi:hypothetical protein